MDDGGRPPRRTPRQRRRWALFFVYLTVTSVFLSILQAANASRSDEGVLGPLGTAVSYLHAGLSVVFVVFAVLAWRGVVPRGGTR